MGAEQGERAVGLPEQADRLRPADLDRVAVALDREEVGDPVDGGEEREDVEDLTARDDGEQAAAAVAREADVAARGGVGLGVRGADGVGTLDGRLEDRLEPGPRQRRQQAGQGAVHVAQHDVGQVAGGRGDLARLPPADPTALHVGPQPR